MYEIHTGSDRGGDTVFYVYDTVLRITVARFDTRQAALDYIASRQGG